MQPTDTQEVKLYKQMSANSSPASFLIKLRFETQRMQENFFILELLCIVTSIAKCQN